MKYKIQHTGKDPPVSLLLPLPPLSLSLFISFEKAGYTLINEFDTQVKVTTSVLSSLPTVEGCYNMIHEFNTSVKVPTEDIIVS